MLALPGWKPGADQIPVPGISALRRSRIFERLVLQTLRREAYALTVCEETITIGGHQMCHDPAAPDMAVEPQSAVHRVNHAVPAAREFGGTESVVAVVGHRRQ